MDPLFSLSPSDRNIKYVMLPWANLVSKAFYSPSDSSLQNLCGKGGAEEGSPWARRPHGPTLLVPGPPREAVSQESADLAGHRLPMLQPLCPLFFHFPCNPENSPCPFPCTYPGHVFQIPLTQLCTCPEAQKYSMKDFSGASDSPPGRAEGVLLGQRAEDVQGRKTEWQGNDTKRS